MLELLDCVSKNL